MHTLTHMYYNGGAINKPMMCAIFNSTSCSLIVACSLVTCACSCLAFVCSRARSLLRSLFLRDKSTIFWVAELPTPHPAYAMHVTTHGLHNKVVAMIVTTLLYIMLLCVIMMILSKSRAEERSGHVHCNYCWFLTC